jgi:endonuclease/exonuclease/phosphatase (EEP) superfamily protein YafD
MTNTAPLRTLLPALILLVGAVVLAFAPDAYLFMLARAFLMQWCLILGAVALLFLWHRNGWTSASAAIGCILILPHYQAPPSSTTTVGDVPDLRVAQMNVFQMNLKHADVLRCALNADADVLSVQEVDAAWAEALRSGLEQHYPFMHLVPQGNCYGMALFSKHPFTEVHTRMVSEVPYIDALLCTPDGPLRVLSVHATSPITHDHFRRRDAVLRSVASRIAAQHVPTVMIGDLNTVHWDGAYKRFRAQSGLRPVNTPGMRTWPHLGPLALIPLDHVLVSPGMGASDVRHFTIPGSDHRGILASIHLNGHAS